MIKTNIKNLVKISVQGQIDNPHMSPLPASPYMVSGDGQPMLVPMYGGLVYNIKLGDRALGWAAELIQAGVSIKNKDVTTNNALGVYACVGNKAIVATGPAAGKTGIVTGKSSRFAEHIICHFDEDTIEQLSPEDSILVQAYGVGLKLEDYPNVQAKSIDPLFIQKLPVKEENGKLLIPVKCVIPNTYAGAGAGFNANNRTVSIMSSDPAFYAEHGVKELCFGDIIAISNWDARYGHGYLRNFITIGCISQGNSFRTGYGPAITVLFTGPVSALGTYIHENSNIKTFL